ncbi:MAG: hypothetical protein AAF212_07955 [Verrucomicrobiota bacterium]
MMTKHINVFFITSLILGRSILADEPPTTVLRERPPVTVEKKRDLPKNLARWHMGTTLIETINKGNQPDTEWALPSGPKQAFGGLLSDDETDSLKLETGRYAYIINFQAPELLDRFFTKSFGGVGKIKILGSTSLQELNSEKWTSLGRRQKIAPGEFLEIRFPPTEAQYVAVVYDVIQAGEFGSLGFLGELSVAETRLPSRLENQNFAQKTEEIDNAFSYDFATAYSGTSIPFSTEDSTETTVENIIDDDFRTYYDMKSSNRPSAMLIDLNETTFINHISLLIEAQAGTVEFYFLDRLPGEDSEESTAFNSSETPRNPIFVKEYWLDALQRPVLLAQSTKLVEIAQNSDRQMREIVLDEGYFDSLDVRYVEEIQEGQDRINIPVDNQNSRYVLMRWIPVTPKPDGSEVSMRIYEISVFGPMPADETFVERGLTLDDIAPAAGGDVATAAEAIQPGIPQDSSAPPNNPAIEEPLVPTINAVSP